MSAGSGDGATVATGMGVFGVTGVDGCNSAGAGCVGAVLVAVGVSVAVGAESVGVVVGVGVGGVQLSVCVGVDDGISVGVDGAQTEIKEIGGGLGVLFTVPAPHTQLSMLPGSTVLFEAPNCE